MKFSIKPLLSQPLSTAVICNIIFTCRNVKSIATLALAMSLNASIAQALTPAKPLALAPHRAIYEMSLGNADRNSGIVSVKGRMVFEFQGNACEGYTQNMRFVTEVLDRRGVATLTDLRSSSWEDGAGERFRFNSQHYRDRNLKETIKGDARRDPKKHDVSVELSKPQKQEITLSKHVLFPNEHSMKLLRSALNGDTVLQARIYDGSEHGKKVFDTTTIIGQERAGKKPAPSKKVPNAQRLDGIASWPVAISYFEEGRKASGEEMPVYELAFRFYANGVSRNLLINYGDFSIRGALKEIEFFKSDICDEKAKD